jgi:hypothetical protein
VTPRTFTHGSYDTKSPKPSCQSLRTFARTHFKSSFRARTSGKNNEVIYFAFFIGYGIIPFVRTDLVGFLRLITINVRGSILFYLAFSIAWIGEGKKGILTGLVSHRGGMALVRHRVVLLLLCGVDLGYQAENACTPVDGEAMSMNKIVCINTRVRKI